MATTKVRKSTPMKNKMKFWRKMSAKQHDGGSEIRTGRKLRDLMRGSNHPGMLLPIHVWLFNAAGIAMPVLAAQIAERFPVVADAANEAIEDATIINHEGAMNAA